MGNGNTSPVVWALPCCFSNTSEEEINRDLIRAEGYRERTAYKLYQRRPILCNFPTRASLFRPLVASSINRSLQDFFKEKKDAIINVAKVLPMGFKNSVSCAQHVHRTVVARAADMAEGHLLGHQELRKDRAFPCSDVIHRVYLGEY